LKSSPNPKTSGNGKLSFLAAWVQSYDQQVGANARNSFGMYHRVKVSIPEQGATTTFAQKESRRSSHLENEAHLEVARQRERSNRLSFSEHSRRAAGRLVDANAAAKNQAPPTPI